MNETEEPEREFELTTFDLARLEDLQIGDQFNGECGLWSISRYKSGYVLTGEPVIKEFPTIDKIKYYFNQL